MTVTMKKNVMAAFPDVTLGNGTGAVFFDSKQVVFDHFCCRDDVWLF